jgi:hypothetical protein
MRNLTDYEAEAQLNAGYFNDTKYLRERVPALFATSPDPRMSSNYGFTNTYELLKFIEPRGYVVDSVQQTGKGPYAKVMVKMHHRESVRLNGDRAQLVLLDSHNGTSAIKLMLGFYRLICSNGMIVGNTLFEHSMKHNQPDVQAQLMLSVLDADKVMPRISNIVNSLQERNVNDSKGFSTFIDRVARARLSNLYGEDASFDRRVMSLSGQLVQRRRREDRSDDLWTMVNVIQENALRGASYYFDGKMNHMREVKAIDAQVRLNREIWNAAQELVV